MPSVLESRAPSLHLLQIITSGLSQGKRELAVASCLLAPGLVPVFYSTRHLAAPKLWRPSGDPWSRLIICLSCMQVDCDFLGSTLSETSPLSICPYKKMFGGLPSLGVFFLLFILASWLYNSTVSGCLGKGVSEVGFRRLLWLSTVE